MHRLGLQAVARHDLLGDPRHEGVGQDLARLVDDVDILDALDLPELVDERLQRRQVAVQQDVHAGIGDSVGDGLAVSQVLARKLLVDRVHAQRRRGQRDQAEEQKDAEHRLLKEPGDPHLAHSFQSRRGTTRPS